MNVDCPDCWPHDDVDCVCDTCQGTGYVAGTVPVRAAQVGDWAEHKSGTLDPRRVTKVQPFIFPPTPDNPDGTGVFIHLVSAPAGPYPAENYVYSQPRTTTPEGSSA